MQPSFYSLLHLKMKTNSIFKLLVFGLIMSPYFVAAQERLPGMDGSSSNESTVTIDPQLKSDLDEVGLYVANRMVNCCSTYGGNNVYSRVSYNDVRKNTLDGSFSIPMTVGWYGSFSGNHYWIKGILKIDSSGNKKWLKQNDSGGPFKEEGCGTRCSL